MMQCYLSTPYTRSNSLLLIGVNENKIKFNNEYFKSKLGCLEVITNEIDVYVL